MPPTARRAACGRVALTAVTTLAVLAGLLLGAGVPATAAPAARSFFTPVDPLARYEAPSTCDPAEKPGAVALRALVQASYPSVNGGGISRGCEVGGRSEHKEGRAWDWMLNAADPVQAARAQDFLQWLLAPDAEGNRYAMARRLGVMYVIWNRQVWESYRADAGWTAYTGPVPHTDHVHISLSWDGALQRTSFWTAAAEGPTPPPTPPAPSPAPTPVPIPSPVPTQPSPGPAPFGGLDAAIPEQAGVRLRGWAIDADAATFTSVVVTVDGAPVATVLADVYYPDLLTTQPRFSPRHGFDTVVPVSAGSHVVCVTALDQNDGDDRSLGCRTVEVAGPPAPPPPPAAPPLTPTSPVTPATPQEPTPAPAPEPTRLSVPPPPTRSVDQSCPADRVPASSFVDVAGSVHAASVGCVAWWQIASGSEAGSYFPERAVTRAQMASFLARTVLASGGWLPPTPADAFGDDEAADQHELAINQLAAVGISNGRGGGAYDPAGIVSRGQMATFLAQTWAYRTGRSLPAGADYFSDDDGMVHEAAIGKVARAGFTGGTAPGVFGPLQATDRGQMATFLARLLDLLVEAGDARTPA